MTRFEKIEKHCRLTGRNDLEYVYEIAKNFCVGYSNKTKGYEAYTIDDKRLGGGVYYEQALDIFNNYWDDLVKKMKEVK